MTIDEVFSEIIKDKSFYENSDGGVTFSGGECMLQIDFLAKILKKCNHIKWNKWQFNYIKRAKKIYKEKFRKHSTFEIMY